MDGNQRSNGILLGLFFGSGCSALIYEVVWFQQLGLVLGASAISLAILLTSFMGGMCLGSLLIDVEINSIHILQNMFTPYGMDLRVWLRGSEINRDHNLRLQYLAGLAPEGRIEQAIIDQITRQHLPEVQTVSASQAQTDH